jgi:hypothetical protein
MEVSRRRRECNLAANDPADYPAAALTGAVARLFGNPAFEFTSTRRQPACAARVHADTV